MARVAREKSKTGIYHIVMRGINKQTLFYDDEDKEVFLSRLKIVKEEKPYEIFAYCLMENHIHLLIEEKVEKIGDILRKVLSSYVYWYNSKYERVGNLFQDRFKSEPIEDDKYFLCCVRYILQNPLKTNIYNIWEYKWSSASLLKKDISSFVNVTKIENYFKDKEQMYQFLEDKEENKFIEWESKIKLTDERLKAKIEKIIKSKNFYEIMKMKKEE